MKSLPIFALPLTGIVYDTMSQSQIAILKQQKLFQMPVQRKLQ